MKRRLPLAVAVGVLLASIRLVAGATVVLDTFTCVAGTALNSHAGELGATWATQTGSANNMVCDDANGLRAGVSGSQTHSYASGTPASAEYSLDLDFVTKASIAGTNFYNIWCRMSTGAQTGYRVYYDPGTPEFGLQSMTAGVATQLATYAGGLSTGTTYHVKLACLTASKKFYLAGVERLTSADNGITQVGKAGLGTGGSTTDTNSTGVHFDNFQVTNAGGTMLLMGVSDRYPLRFGFRLTL